MSSFIRRHRADIARWDSAHNVTVPAVGCFFPSGLSCSSVSNSKWSLHLEETLILPIQCNSRGKRTGRKKESSYKMSISNSLDSWVVLGSTGISPFDFSWFSKLMLSYVALLLSSISLAFFSWICSRMALFTPGPEWHRQRSFG